MLNGHGNMKTSTYINQMVNLNIALIHFVFIFKDKNNFL